MGSKHSGMEKRGSINNNTEAAHKFSWRVLKAALKREKGAPLNEDRLRKAMNCAGNLRIKSQEGNRILDERRDKRLANILEFGEKTTEKTTKRRIGQAYTGGKCVADKYAELGNSRSKKLDNIANRVGNVEYKNGKHGRDPKIKYL